MWTAQCLLPDLQQYLPRYNFLFASQYRAVRTDVLGVWLDFVGINA
jgi:hypothetical protein